MGIRVHPDWCNKGVGTEALRALADWAFRQGITSLRLDVCAANPRAIRCYEKTGFVRTGEFWHEDPAQDRASVNRPGNEVLKSHVRFDGPIPQIRFYWMELLPKPGA